MSGKNLCAIAVSMIVLWAGLSGAAPAPASSRDACTNQVCKVKALNSAMPRASFPVCNGARYLNQITDADAGVLRMCASDGGWNDVAGSGSSSGAAGFFYDGGAGFIYAAESLRNPDGGSVQVQSTVATAPTEALTLGIPSTGFPLAAAYVGFRNNGALYGAVWGSQAISSAIFDGLNLWSSSRIAFSTGGTGPATTNSLQAVFFAKTLTFDQSSGNNAITLTTGARINLGSALFYGASTYAELSGDGLRFPGLAAASFATAPASIFQADSNSGRLFFTSSASRTNTSPVDLGGAPHPTLQQRVYAWDVGYFSGAASNWYPTAPTAAGAAVTIVETVSAATSGSTVGTTPYKYDQRCLNTTAVAAQTSTMISSAAFIDLDRGPRWSARVRIGSTTAIRAWEGLASALPGASDTPATSKVGFRFSSAAGDTAWMACYGAAGTTCTSTGVAPSLAPGNLLVVDCREGTAACTFWVDGVARLRQTSGLPASGVGLAMIHTVETLGAVAKSSCAGITTIETN